MIGLVTQDMKNIPIDIRDNTPFFNLALNIEIFVEILMQFAVFAAVIHLQRLHDVRFGHRKTFLVRPFKQHNKVIDLVQRYFLHSLPCGRAAKNAGLTRRQGNFVRFGSADARLLQEQPMDLNKIKNLALSETGFLFDPATGNTYTLNESAVFILKALKDGKSPHDIAGALTAEFDVSEQQAHEDVSDAFLQLKEAGFIAAGAAW